jgi:CubicO group peptidase (beta-lactamase class C family)
MDYKAKMAAIESQLGEHFAAGLSSGMAIAIVKGDEIVYTKCFGHADIESGKAMTEDTIFDVGSVSKAFTSTSVALLVDQEKFKWDQPVKEFYPKFRLHDEFAASRTTVRDMLSHRTGLPRHDFLWYLDKDFDYNKLIDALPNLEFSKDPRTTWQYNNLMYNTSALLVSEFSGKSFPDFLDTEVFRKLEMSNSTLDHDKALATGKFASPYRIVDGKPVKIDYFSERGVYGAGGVKSTLADLANWVKFHVNKGQFNGTTVLSRPNAIALQQATMIVGGAGLSGALVEGEESYTKIPTYGMGWFVEVYRGHELVQHGGNIDGFSSLVSFIPDEELGVITLCNEDGSILPIATTLMIYDAILNLDTMPWLERGIRRASMNRAGGENAKAGLMAQKVEGTTPSLSLSEYAGTYKKEGYPEFKIELRDNGLWFITPRLEFPMEHIHYDTFMLVIERFNAYLNLQFNLNTTGEVAEFFVPLDGLLPPMKFERQPDTISEEEMRKYTGKYQFMDQEWDLTIRDGKLTCVFPSKAENGLEFIRGTRFKMEGGQHVEFKFVSNDKGTYDIKILMMGTLRDATRID